MAESISYNYNSVVENNSVIGTGSYLLFEICFLFRNAILLEKVEAEKKMILFVWKHVCFRKKLGQTVFNTC